VIDDLASVDPWRPRGIKVRGSAVVEDDNGRARIRIRPEVTWSWGLNVGHTKRFGAIERRNVV
jgi:pyridoxamine 5'-phosphate oxidase family protein